MFEYLLHVSRHEGGMTAIMSSLFLNPGSLIPPEACRELADDPDHLGKALHEMADQGGQAGIKPDAGDDTCVKYMKRETGH